VEFYKKVIDFALKNEIVVVQDAAHVMFSYDGRPLSFLEVPGAREVGVEVHSLSKGWNMIGWRLGWVCGNELLVRAFADVKDNCDSGQFIAIQKAAIVALDNPEIPRGTRAKYERRLRLLVETLRRLGFQCGMPGGTYFLYAPSPKGIAGGPSFANAEASSQYLITEQSICTVPWDDAGAYLRFSVTYEAPDEAAENALMAALEERLNGLRFIF
jgi:LL-diaminopimelate aminotransferase